MVLRTNGHDLPYLLHDDTTMIRPKIEKHCNYYHHQLSDLHPENPVARLMLFKISGSRIALRIRVR